MIEPKTLDKRTTLKSAASLRAKHNRKVAISATMWVLLSLLSVQLVWDFPKQLFLAVIGIFLFCSILFWFVKRNCPRLSSVHVVQMVVFWLLFTGILFGGVYHVDHAGWNWFKLTGYNVTLSEEYFDRIDETPLECANRYDFISTDPDDATRLVVRSAVHQINETVIIPRHVALTIEPGVELRFGAGCSLISYSPIFARGTEANPIVFTAKTKLLKWGVIGLVEVEGSVFEHVRFEHGRQARVNNVDFVAGLSVIGGSVRVTDCYFTDMFGKDAMNVRYGKVQIRNNFFQNTFKDGLDLDGGSGEVSFNEFVNCGDEGIDLSENEELRVFSNKVLDHRGGRISADSDLDQIRSLNALGYSEK